MVESKVFMENEIERPDRSNYDFNENRDLGRFIKDTNAYADYLETNVKYLSEKRLELVKQIKERLGTYQEGDAYSTSVQDIKSTLCEVATEMKLTDRITERMREEAAKRHQEKEGPWFAEHQKRIMEGLKKDQDIVSQMAHDRSGRLSAIKEAPEPPRAMSWMDELLGRFREICGQSEMDLIELYGLAGRLGVCHEAGEPPRAVAIETIKDQLMDIVSLIAFYRREREELLTKIREFV